MIEGIWIRFGLPLAEHVRISTLLTIVLLVLLNVRLHGLRVGPLRGLLVVGGTNEGLVHRVLQELGGQATLTGIYEKAENHPRRLTNPTWTATVRRTLQEIAIPVTRGIWRL